jgi:hypothetical protein
MKSLSDNLAESIFKVTSFPANISFIESTFFLVVIFSIRKTDWGALSANIIKKKWIYIFEQDISGFKIYKDISTIWIEEDIY